MLQHGALLALLAALSSAIPQGTIVKLKEIPNGPATEDKGIEVEVPAMACAVMVLRVYPTNVMEIRHKQNFKPHVLLSDGGRVKPGGASGVNCWIDPNNKDGNGDPCGGCNILDENRTMETEGLCRNTMTTLFYEVFNPGPNNGTLKYWGVQQFRSAVSTTRGQNCRNKFTIPPDQCSAADVPGGCHAPGDGTGGVPDRVSPSAPCSCSCLGGWSGSKCDVPPSCNSFDTSKACNGNPCNNVAQNGELTKPGLAVVGGVTPLSKDTFKQSTAAGGVVVTEVCKAGYAVDTSRTLTCQQQGSSAVADGDICIARVDDCQSSPCTGSFEECHDADGVADGKFECRCRQPLSGSPPCTDCSNTTSCSADQRCDDTDASPNNNYTCHCLPPLTGSAANAPATCASPAPTTPTAPTTPGIPPTPPPTNPTPGGCSSRPCGASQDCSDVGGSFVCSCSPPLTGTATSGKPAACTKVAAEPPDDEETLGFWLGIAIGAAFACALCLFVVLYCMWKRKKEREDDLSPLIEASHEPLQPLRPLLHTADVPNPNPCAPPHQDVVPRCAPDPTPPSSPSKDDTDVGTEVECPEESTSAEREPVQAPPWVAVEPTEDTPPDRLAWMWERQESFADTAVNYSSTPALLSTQCTVQHFPDYVM